MLKNGFWQHGLGTSYRNSACFDKDDTWRKKAVSRAVHVDDDPFTPEFSLRENSTAASRGPEGRNSERTFHLVNSYFVENFKEKVTRDFYIFSEAAVFLTKEPGVSRDLHTGGDCSRRTFAVLYCAVFRA